MKIKPRVVTKELSALQVTPIQLPDGQLGLVMVSSEGGVYTYEGTGWRKLPMGEVDDAA